MTTYDWLQAWPLLLGWPAIFAMCLLVYFAVRKRKPALSVLAMLLVAPLSFYLLSSPVYWWVGIAVILALIVLSIILATGNNSGREKSPSS